MGKTFPCYELLWISLDSGTPLVFVKSWHRHGNFLQDHENILKEIIFS